MPTFDNDVISFSPSYALTSMLASSPFKKPSVVYVNANSSLYALVELVTVIVTAFWVIVIGNSCFPSPCIESTNSATILYFPAFIIFWTSSFCSL